MKHLLSILFIVDERMVIFYSYVNDSVSYIVAKPIAGGVCDNSYAKFFTVRMFLQHVESEKGVQSCQK